MNKHLLILGIAVLLICVGLSGCNEDSRFSGTWEGGFAEDSGEMGISKIVFTGGNDAVFTVSMKMVGYTETYKVTTYDGTYKVEGDTLILTNEIGGAYILTYRFETEDGEEVLYLNGSKFTKRD